jgi:hypothetical protein
MRRRELIAGLFVLVMVGLGGAVILHWRAVQPRISVAPDQNTFNNEWRPADRAQYTAAKMTIAGQLSAFQSGDFRKATFYQSGMLRQSFMTTDNFRSVITSRYPQFCHFTAVSYGRCVTDPDGDSISMEIMLTGQGTRTRAFYVLHKENGLYRVAQVIVGEDAFRLRHRPFYDRPDSPMRIGEDASRPPIRRAPPFLYDRPHQ